MLVDLLGRADLLDAAVVEHRDPVAHGQGLVLVMGDEDEGDADLVLDRLQFDLHFLAEFEVERTERLVEEEHLGPVHEGSGESDPLALAAPTAGRAGAVRTRRDGPYRGAAPRAGGARPD